MEQERRRRIDRVTADDFLDGLADRDLAEVRAMRDDCREEETRLSYARRLLHGQLDIVRAEQGRRSGGESGDLVETLSAILSDDPTPRSRDARTTPVYAPQEGGYGQRAHDTLVDDPAMGLIPDLSDEDLAELFSRLQTKEQHISLLRRTILDHLDALQDEVIRRYRDGSINVDDLVASAVPSPEDRSD
jgi:hypothetical protein